MANDEHWRVLNLEEKIDISDETLHSHVSAYRKNRMWHSRPMWHTRLCSERIETLPGDPFSIRLRPGAIFDAAREERYNPWAYLSVPFSASLRRVVLVVEGLPAESGLACVVGSAAYSPDLPLDSAYPP